MWLAEHVGASGLREHANGRAARAQEPMAGGARERARVGELRGRGARERASSAGAGARGWWSEWVRAERVARVCA
jgi:hypothetical protein